MKLSNRKSAIGIQYVGAAGTTKECAEAVMRLIQYGDEITRVRILSCFRPDACGEHGLLLTVNDGDLIGVKSGFSSGYIGEGPRGFAFVLQLLEFHGVDIDEYEVEHEVIERLDMSLLTKHDVDALVTVRPIRPRRWHYYITEDDRKRSQTRQLWRDFPPVIPLGIIDSRIMDLALDFFASPDEKLLIGYRRLEDIVRKRTEIANHGVKLFSEAFHGENARLTWNGLTSNERTGRANLFIGAYMAYRNPRAHRELEHHPNAQLMEFLLLNHLFALERDAV